MYSCCSSLTASIKRIAVDVNGTLMKYLITRRQDKTRHGNDANLKSVGSRTFEVTFGLCSDLGTEFSIKFLRRAFLGTFSNILPGTGWRTLSDLKPQKYSSYLTLKLGRVEKKSMGPENWGGPRKKGRKEGCAGQELVAVVVDE